jgi:hypothetical protein
MGGRRCCCQAVHLWGCSISVSARYSLSPRFSFSLTEMVTLFFLEALFEQNLLPRIISGASAGSIVAAIVGALKNEEMPLLWEVHCTQRDMSHHMNGVFFFLSGGHNRSSSLHTQEGWADVPPRSASLERRRSVGCPCSRGGMS